MNANSLKSQNILFLQQKLKIRNNKMDRKQRDDLIDCILSVLDSYGINHDGFDAETIAEEICVEVEAREVFESNYQSNYDE